MQVTQIISHIYLFGFYLKKFFFIIYSRQIILKLEHISRVC
jgi:hypothetical protein